jgi:hypothetical protein
VAASPQFRTQRCQEFTPARFSSAPPFGAPK